MFKRLQIYTLYLVFLFISFSTYADEEQSTIPTTILLQATAAVDGDTGTNTTITMNIGIYEGDITQDTTNSLWNQDYSISLNHGSFTQVLGEDPTNPIDAAIFLKDDLHIGFRVKNGSTWEDVQEVPLNAVPYSFHSEISYAAKKLYNESLIYLDTVNTRVGINNTNPQYALDVGGTINATAFVGDGSGLTNIQISDDRLVWIRNSYEPSEPEFNDIYYNAGNVGIGTKTPTVLLHVSGNARVSGNLTVSDSIEAGFLVGDGSGITSINATQVTSGTLPSDRLSGAYTNVTGIGTITEGTWQGTPIVDQYIANNLTLDGASIMGNNTISGNITISAETSISGNASLDITTQIWSISAGGELNIITANINDSILIYDNIIESLSPTGIQFKPSDSLGLFISPSGSVGVNTISPQSTFHVNGGIVLGYTDEEINGMLRYNSTDGQFEAFSEDEWLIIDSKTSYDAHALHSENDEIKNLVYVNSDGNVGIGGIPSQDITESFMVSGNVVFKGEYTAAGNSDDLTITGSGARLMWYPQKSAFRAGNVADSNGNDKQWDRDNIGPNTIAFGESNKASGSGAVIVGGSFNANSDQGSVIVGGSYNSIDSTGNFNSIIGGGGTDSNKNSITGSSSFSTIIGGIQNKVDNSNYSTIIGGTNSIISDSSHSVAIGQNITINEHDNVVIISAGQEPVSSSYHDQFLIFATGNVGINTAPLADITLNVGGTIRAFNFNGDGSNLSNIKASQLGDYFSSTVASPNSILVSGNDGYLPTNSVDGDSITPNAIDSSHIIDGSISSLDIADGAITSENIADNAVTSEKIADGAVTGAKLQEHSISSKNIVDGGIVSGNIKENSIYSYHIVDYQIISEKIATDTIDSSRILDFTITSMDIGIKQIASFNIEDDAIRSNNIEYATIVSDNISENAIQSQHITPNAVSSRNIADNAILSYHIADYSIHSDHITENAILTQHIASEVITNNRIADNMITSEKIALDAILSEHIPENTIAGYHIASASILAYHIAEGVIDGAKLADNTITSLNIADGAITSKNIADSAVTSEKIADGTITSSDIAVYALTTEYFAANSITAINIADGGISSKNIADNSIDASKIIDGSITSADIQLASITTEYIQDGTITTELIASGAITNELLAENSITAENLATGSITWDKIATQNTDGSYNYLPAELIEEGSISGDKLADSSITGENIADASITSANLADGSIPATALIGVVPVANGGTGTTSLDQSNGSVVYVTGNAFAGDPANLYFDSDNKYLGVGTNAPEYSLHVDGNIFTEGGTVFFGDVNNSISFSSSEFWNNQSGFIIIGPNDVNDIDNSIAQGTIKINQLYVTNKLGIGQGFDPVEGPSNTLAVSGNMSIGATYGDSAAPDSGLIVEGKVGIGTDSPTYQLEVIGGIKASGIYGTGTEDGIGIFASGGSTGISLNSEVGIDITADEFGIKAMATGDNASGIEVTVENPANGSFAVKGIVQDGSGGELVTGALGYYSTAHISSIYGSATAESTDTETYWAGYFDGPVKISERLAIGTAENPDATLDVGGSSLFEKTVSIVEEEISSTTIDWGENNKFYYDCNSSVSLTFEDTSSNQNIRILTLRVNATSGSCGISGFTGDIKWEKAYDTSLLNSLNSGSTYIFSFFYDGTTYYGTEPLEFN